MRQRRANRTITPIAMGMAASMMSDILAPVRLPISQ